MDIRSYRHQQVESAKKVVIKDDFKNSSLIAGADQSSKENRITSAIAVLNSKLELIDKSTATETAQIPYIPGLLYFREGPAIASAYGKLENKPDIMMIEGHGILHPLKIGIASHIGVALNTPTIGIAKNLICGEVDKNGKVVYNDEILGAELRTMAHGKPIYISPGHRISLETSIEIVKKNIKPPHKLPEPLHIARKLSKKAIK